MILVAYATRAGSTAEVAEMIADVLRTKGLDVLVSNVRQVRDISPYDGVVLGSAVRMGKLMPEMVHFARRHTAQLRARPAVCFTLGVTMNENTVDRRRQAEKFIQPLVSLLAPARIGTFGGKVDPAKLGFPWRITLKWVEEGDMAPGDHRDFKAIRDWAEDVSSLFQGQPGLSEL
ncbi:MAG: flavodoxin domain-containing protein [Anaerolineae bacterium]